MGINSTGNDNHIEVFDGGLPEHFCHGMGKVIRVSPAERDQNLACDLGNCPPVSSPCQELPSYEGIPSPQ